MDRLDDQVAELRNQIETLARTMSGQVRQALEMVDANLEAQREQSRDVEGMINARVDEHVARVTEEHAKVVHGLEDRLNARVDSSAQTYRQELTELAEKFDGAARQLAARVGDHTRQASETNQRVNAELAASFQALRNDVDQQQASIREALTATRTDNDGQLAALRDEMLGDLAALRESSDSARNEFAEKLEAVAKESASTAFTMMRLRDRVAEIDVEALDHLRERVTSLAGETALVRIEMDRLTGSIDDRFDRIQFRLTDVESVVESDADVSLAVQSDRLDELERAISELDPDRFVLRESEPDHDHDHDGDGDGEHVAGLHMVPHAATGGE